MNFAHRLGAAIGRWFGRLVVLALLVLVWGGAVLVFKLMERG